MTMLSREEYRATYDESSNDEGACTSAGGSAAAARVGSRYTSAGPLATSWTGPEYPRTGTEIFPSESVGPAEGVAPGGAKGDPITLGALALTVLPTLLPKLVEFLVEWVKDKKGRTVKFQGTINGQAVVFEGSGDDLRKLLSLLQGGQEIKKEPSL